MTIKNDQEQNSNFRLKAVAELLDGHHNFFIPSYQRGYRWDRKQVEDLLKDIWDFAKKDENKKNDFYCLQPIVVKEDLRDENEKKWIVIDGQQRLTTLFLMINHLKQGSRAPFVKNSIMYGIKYETRKNLDFDNPQKDLDIDSFHVFQSKAIIEKWFSDREEEIDYTALEKVIFNKSTEIPQVKVIWYVAENEYDIDSIKVFNNLNKGKIKLTNSELIKALFILKARNGNEQLNLNELAFEWNEMENALHDDQLWYFLANNDYKPSTRIDIIFDFLTGKSEKDDSDFSYRKFQDLYDDNCNDNFWKNKDVGNFTDAWNKVKEVFQTFTYWFEDSTLYHYIGYLIYWKVPIQDIYTQSIGKSKNQIIKEIQGIIKSEFLKDIKDAKDIDDLNYTDDYKECKKVLLFFNIETCVKQQQNQNGLALNLENRESLTYYKFPFDSFKLNNWNIEHVGSKTDNPLNEINDKIIWLSYIEDITCSDKNWEDLKKESLGLKTSLKEKKKDEGNKFNDLYQRILLVIQKDSPQNEEQTHVKDAIENLALLDEGTNKGYGNALFPTKRQQIIENDKNGIFIPICTKNLFLKYYTSDDETTSQWKNNWTIEDKKAYLKSIHETIDFIFK